MAAAGAVAILAAGIFAAVQLSDGSTRTDATDTTPSCTTEAPTTSLPTSSSTTAGPAPTATVTSTTTAPPTPVPATVLGRGSSTRPVVALTFDAGSDAGSTTRILDLLSARGVEATFGLTGCWVETNPDLARRIVADGHGILNHTQDHRSFTGFSTDTAPLATVERERQLRGAEQAIRRATDVDPRPWFRPPYGDYDEGVLEDAAAAGYGYVVMWSIDSLGWKGLPPTEVAARTIAALEPGAIVLMHVGSASSDVDALPGILDAARRRGLEPVTIADLVGG